MQLITALKVPFLLLRTVFDGLNALLLGSVLRPKRWSYKENLRYSILRSINASGLLDIIASSGKAKKTMDVYRTVVESQDQKPEIVDLEKGARGGWIGSSKGEYVVLYFHGGGFVMPAHVPGLQRQRELVATARQQGHDFSIFVVEYGLAPDAQYPLQMTQAAIALNYLIETAGYQPENIFIFGQSAGGNLALQLISHLSHPHPEVPTVDLKGKKLAGLFLASPWVTFEQNTASMKSNEHIDLLRKKELVKLSAQFLGSASVDSYNVPLSAAPEWWRDLPVQDIFVSCGEYEIFLDDVKEWSGKLQTYNPRAELYLAPGETHVHMAAHPTLGLGLAKSDEQYRDWILNSL